MLIRFPRLHAESKVEYKLLPPFDVHKEESLIICNKSARLIGMQILAIQPSSAIYKDCVLGQITLL